MSEPLPTYEVVGVGPLRTRLQLATRRGLVQFVGRRHELTQIRSVLQLAVAGQGQIVALVGEAGVGKSRLVYEGKLGVPQDVLVLEAFSVSHGKAFPYLPLIDLLKHYFAITPQDNERTRREKVTGKVLTLDRRLDETLPYLFALLDVRDAQATLQQMDLEIRRRRTFEALKQLLLRESLNQPLLVIFEDLHWVDSESRAFLDLLSDSLATARLVLLVNYRPEYQHSWGSKTFYTQLRLDPLGKAEANELLSFLMGDRADVQPIKQIILERTEGNPFFMEEIVHALFEQGMLVRNGDITLAQPFSEIQIPPTVQGVLAARIDRLDANDKALLQSLAVVGKEFPFSLLKQVVNLAEDDLYQRLARLQEAEFVYEQPAFPEPDYTFKHALTQEAAYHALLVEQRQVLHERTAQAIEGLYADDLEEHYGALAHHYQHSHNTEKAVTYLQRAAQQAMQRAAPEEAIAAFRTALALLTTLPDTAARRQSELVLQAAFGVALSHARGYADPEVGRIYDRARELYDQVGESPQLISVMRGLWTFYHTTGALQTAREIAEELLHQSQRQPDNSIALYAHRFVGATLSELGELPAARQHLERALTLYDPQQHRTHSMSYGQDPQVTCLCHLARGVLWQLGYPGQALQRGREALALAQELAHPFSLMWAINSLVEAHLLRREGRAAHEQAQALVALTGEHGFSGFHYRGQFMMARALVLQGQIKDGVAAFRKVEHMFQDATTPTLFRFRDLVPCAELYGQLGQADEGLRLLAEAQVGMEPSDGRLWTSEVYRIKGDLLLSGSEAQQTEAETSFQKALDIARHQQAKSLELRAATSLASLWQSQAKRQEARDLLAPVYGWFTEGFDTADLKEAKALLQELEG